VNAPEITFISILVIIVAFYLVTIRPAQQEQKRQQQTIRDLHVGDEVITTAGFFARVKEIRTPEEGPVELVLDLGSGLDVRALTTSVLRRVEPAGSPSEAAAGRGQQEGT